MNTRSRRLFVALLSTLVIGVWVTLPGYGVLPAGKGVALAETPAEKAEREKKLKAKPVVPLAKPAAPAAAAKPAAAPAAPAAAAATAPAAPTAAAKPATAPVAPAAAAGGKAPATAAPAAPGAAPAAAAGPGAPAPGAKAPATAAPAAAGAPAGSAPTAASPSGDVTWAPAGSVPAPQGDAKFFCRIHNPQGVVGGYVAGQKCVVALGNGISSAQFDVLSGNTQGYRLVAAQRPEQVPGAIVVGEWAGHQGWVCAARQPNGGYQMGRTMAGAPCMHFDGQKNVSFTSNLAALAPTAAVAGSAGGPTSPPMPGGGAPAGSAPGAAPAAAGSNAASPSGDVTWAPVGSVPASQGDAKFFCRIHNPQGVVGGYVAGQKCIVALGNGISSAQFDVLSGNTQGYRLVAAQRPEQVPGAVFVGEWAGHQGWVCAARQPNSGYQMGRTMAGAPCLHFDGQKNVSFTSNLAALAPPAGK